MAVTMKDCKTGIPQLLSAINLASAEFPKIRAEMEDLGFGTAKQLRLVTKLYLFIKVVGGLSPKVLGVTVSFVKCMDSALAGLTVDELKGVVRALHAHAELVIAGIPEGSDQTPEQAALLKTFQAWLQTLNDIITQFPMASADKLMTLLKDAKKSVNTASPIVLKLLVEVFGAELTQAIANGAIEDLTDRKTLLKKLAEKVLISALGKAAAEKAVPYVDEALTGWEILVELAGNTAIKDVRDYINQLLVMLIVLMKKCGWGWTQNLGKDPNGNQYYGFRVSGDKYKDATVVARAFIRCAKLVDGKPEFSARCPVTFTTGEASITTKLTEEIRVKGVWIVVAAIDMRSVQAAPCITGASYCYAYFQLTFTYTDGTTNVMNIITGVQTFP